MRKHLEDRARLIELIIRDRANGDPPKTLSGAVRIAGMFGLDCDPHHGTPGYVADLIEWDTDRWSIRVNPLQATYRKVQAIYHELAEYLQLVLEPGFWDDLLDVRFDGTGNADYERHLVSTLVAHRLAGLQKRDVPRHQPFNWARYSRPRSEIEYIPAAQCDQMDWRTYGRMAG